jgi:hypothetical protein
MSMQHAVPSLAKSLADFSQSQAKTVIPDKDTKYLRKYPLPKLTRVATNSNVFAALSGNSYKALIKTEDIAPITARPKANTLVQLLNQLSAGARGMECFYSNFGFLYYVLPEQIYRDLILARSSTHP